MKLIDAVASGIRGAENGWVELYIRGTSTRATWYPDFEATSSNSSGADVDLDSDGAAVIYVNRLVTVVVKTEGGETVKTFVAGETASASEYQGVGFTGTNYQTAASGAGSGYATTVQAILDLARTKFGAADWSVANPTGGAAIPVGEALSGVVGLFFFPQSETYGAAADGTTDDTSALQSCLTAAGTAGGIVVLGAGTYRITSALTVPVGVSLWGNRYASTIITIDHASNTALSFAASGAALQPPAVVQGLTVQAAQAHTGALISVPAATHVQFSNCLLGGTLCASTILNVNATGRVTLDDCYFQAANASSASLVNGGTLHAHRTYFTPTGTAYAPTNGFVYVAAMRIESCFFTSAATAGTFTYIQSNTTTLNGRVTSSSFADAAGATVTALTLGSYTSASEFHEDDNTFGTTVTAYSYTNAIVEPTGVVWLGTREKRAYRFTNSDTTPDCPIKQYGVISLVSTTAGNSTLTFDGIPPSGAKGVILVRNEDGSSRNFTAASLISTSTATVSVASNGTNAWFYTLASEAVLGTPAFFYASKWSA